MTDTSSAERFLNIYNTLDTFLRNFVQVEFDVSHTEVVRRAAEKRGDIKYRAQTLKGYANLRNAIVHNPDSRAQPIAEPHERIVHEYESIVENILRPPKCDQKWIPKDDIFSAKSSDNVVSVMKKMFTSRFSNVPIVKENVVVGVFNEWTPLEIASDTGELMLDDSQQLGEFAQWTELTRTANAQAVNFAKRDSTLDEVREIIGRNVKKRIRIGMVLFTEHGRPNERLLGLITPWDII